MEEEYGVDVEVEVDEDSLDSDTMEPEEAAEAADLSADTIAAITTASEVVEAIGSDTSNLADEIGDLLDGPAGTNGCALLAALAAALAAARLQ